MVQEQFGAVVVHDQTPCQCHSHFAIKGTLSEGHAVLHLGKTHSVHLCVKDYILLENNVN